MKNVLPITLFIILFSIDFLTSQLGILPVSFSWILEGLIAIILIIVMSRIIGRKSFCIPIKYLIVFMCFLYVVIAGIIINEISTLTIISGIRVYLKYIPLFLLPLAYDYSIKDLKKQFLILLIFGLLQLPVVIWQRFVEHKWKYTGDVITGTLSLSNSLTFMMIGLILVLAGLYIKKVVTLKAFIALSIILFLPTALNETKVTVILLPIGIIALLFVMKEYLNKRQVAMMLSAGFFMLLIFSFVYDQLYSRVEGVALLDKKTTSYVFKGYQADPRIVFDENSVYVGEFKNLPANTIIAEFGRLDSFLIPLNIFSKHDLTRLFFGFGISNITSKLGDGARYLHILAFGGSSTTLSLMIWETGILGAILFIIFIVFVIKDSYELAKRNNSYSLFSGSWFAISIVILLTAGYNTLFHIDEIMCLYIYFSGIVVFNKYPKREDAPSSTPTASV